MTGAGGPGPVLVVNTGSSTLKLSLVAAGVEEPVASALLEDWSAGEAGADAIAGFAAGHGVAAVGHRVVHGGSRFVQAVRVDDGVRAALAGLTPLAPLHQPRALAGIDAARRALPAVPHVACFDTAFHATLPREARTYALPSEWVERFGIRRYGFHGLSVRWSVERAGILLDREP
ncbi:MAG TPA: propionate/acetate kinase, partial [Acidimicrobiales bacterium]|nr:propionate/acetate kinase [Acidimicrobiales bacterium]